MYKVNWLDDAGNAQCYAVDSFVIANLYAMMLTKTFDAEFITIEAM